MLLNHPTRGPKARAAIAVSICGAALVAAGCSARKEPEATQVAAKVNKQEISVHQLNFVLQRQPGLKPDQLGAASRKTLDALIDQELALQAASQEKVDRDPAVLQAVEAARRDIIARAYAERLAEHASPATPDEVTAYYNAHPHLFAQRRLYSLTETAVESTPAQQKSLNAVVASSKGADDLAASLRQVGLRFGTRQTTLGAEALPLPAVEPMAALREGQSYLLAGPSGGRIFTVNSVQRASLSLDEARPLIEKYLLADRKQQLVQQQIRALRDAARIEYQGQFAQLVPTLAVDDAPPRPATPAEPGASAASTGLDNATLGRGLVGLK